MIRKAKHSPVLRGRPSRKREGNVAAPAGLKKHVLHPPVRPPSGRVEHQRGEDRGLCVLRRRGGYVMVLFAMLLFAIMAMAALVIDIGFARVAQRQMQSAADSAALEGLRGEGVTDYAQRQDAAQRMISWTFDDELDTTIGDSGTVDFGSVARFSGGAGDPNLNASQLMTVDANNSTVIDRSPNPLAANQFSVAVQRGGIVNRD